MAPVRIAVLGLGLLLAASSAGAADLEIRYNRDVRPVLAENCFACHGPDAGTRKAKLRLDVRENAVAKQAIVPGDPSASSLIKRLESADPEEVMPPPSTHKTVTTSQRELLRRWIQSGAVYEAHWAYLPIRRPAPPLLAKGMEGAGHPVDRWIRLRLEAEGLGPAPEADRATLLRRLSLDLVGLPPSTRELDDFLKDPSPLAYERQVERLLASPHFGERMAIPWLDAVRFADTVGYHGDQNQRIFPYRDYVIASFNVNKGFDRFTVEQIAGDLLDPPEWVATGFNRLNMMTREGGAQPKEYLAKYQADRVRTVSTTWLGSTLACAECHDHKYDPFSMRDFYSMAAYFGDLQQWGVYQDYNYTPNPDLKGWSNDHPFPPEIEVESPYLRDRINRLRGDIRALAQASLGTGLKSPDSRKPLETWTKETTAFLEQHPQAFRVLLPAEVSTRVGTNSPVRLEPGAEGVVQFPGSGATTDRLEFPLETGGLACLSIELLPDPANGGRITRGDRDNLTLEVTASLRRAGASEDEKLSFRFAAANFSEPRYANGHDLVGVHRGWRTSAAHRTERHDSVWWLARPVRVASGDRLVLTLRNSAAARLRVAASPVAPEGVQGEPRSGHSRLAGRLPSGDALAELFLRSTALDRPAYDRFLGLQSDIDECREGRAWTLVAAGTTNVLVTRVLPRGNWMDESGPVVTPAVPHFLPGPGQGPAAATEGAKSAPGPGANRLQLARWLVSTENPLTARNFVNRLWAQFFGAGLSARLEDLGLQGEWPTHPELLDWLASEFMEPTVLATPVPGVPGPHAWDVKHLVRLVVNSATYRQSTEPSVRAREMDPMNRLLARQTPRRLEAEIIRDQALAVAGLLRMEIGGPSVFPYQPAGYYGNLQFPDRDYRAQRDDRQYRRGLYMHWQRTFLHPMLANFDAQGREECVAARIQSNTPQQALTLLNDPTFVEASRALATLALREAGDDPARIDLCLRRALARAPKPAERDSLLTFLVAQRAYYRANTEEARKLGGVGNLPLPSDLEPVEVASWANVARVVLNLHETLTRY